MDPLIVATSVADVAVMGVHLSQAIYALICTFRETEKEMSAIANNLSLLAMVLNELEGILRQDSRVYRRRMVRVVNEMLDRCKGIFQSISKNVVVDPQGTKSSKQIRRKLRRYFQRHRVRPLQARLGSIKSTFDVLLHVVHVARVTEAVESFIPNDCPGLKYADIQKESRILVGVVQANRRSILNLKQIEEDCDRRQNLQNDKRKAEGIASDVPLDDSTSKIEPNHGPPESMDSGEFGLFRGWEGGSSAKTSKNTGLFSKDTKSSATDTTCSTSCLFGDEKRDEKTIIYAGLDRENFGPPDKQMEENRARCDDDWDALSATVKRKHSKKKRYLLDNVSNISDPIGIDGVVGNTQEAADDSRTPRDAASFNDKKGKERKDSMKLMPKEVEKNDQTSQNVSVGLCKFAKSGSHSEHAAKVGEVSEAGSSGITFNDDTKHTIGADNLPSSTGSQEHSLSQSPASEYYSISPENPVTDTTNSHHPKDDLVVDSRRPKIAASAEGLAAKLSKSQPSPPITELVTPTAQWFLSVVPHESSISALTKTTHPEEENLRVRAEGTIRTLLANWTNVDPDLVFGEDDSWGGDSTAESNFHLIRPSRDEDVSNQPCQTSYTPPVYPLYAPQQWYAPSVILSNEKKTDSEELARLKKLILDEKAEQDARAALAAAVAPSKSPNLIQDTQEDTVEVKDSTQWPQEQNAFLKAKPARRPPVIMRDWLGRKFIFPVDMCQTWEELHNLIQEAFGHVLEYRSMVEKGCYSITHITGEGILPSTWELFVQPGLEINMEIWDVFDVERDEIVGEAMVGGRKDRAGPNFLQPPPPPRYLGDMPRHTSSIAIRSRSDSDPIVDDVMDDKTEDPFQDGISYVERSDPRYLSIENVLLKQKKATIEVQMKLERSRRFFQLKQQLIDQGVTIQARQDAAEHFEQDTKLAWLEKQVRDQKEELDRLPPLLTYPPSSSAGNLLRKSASNSQRRTSFGARLLGRMPSRSIRSKGSIRSQKLVIGD